MQNYVILDTSDDTKSVKLKTDAIDSSNERFTIMDIESDTLSDSDFPFTVGQQTSRGAIIDYAQSKSWRVKYYDNNETLNLL